MAHRQCIFLHKILSGRNKPNIKPDKIKDIIKASMRAAKPVLLTYLCIIEDKYDADCNNK
ncbi:hypothetical protein HZS_4711 [Henneguya salminicola]|nr:hypothetical protein HZS_4711 [Henneguya salminicola]